MHGESPGDGHGLLFSCNAVFQAVHTSSLPHPSGQFLAKPGIFGEAISCRSQNQGTCWQCPGCVRYPWPSLEELRLSSFQVSWFHLGTRCIQLAWPQGTNFSWGSTQEAWMFCGSPLFPLYFQQILFGLTVSS